jgi:hypothetical protein
MRLSAASLPRLRRHRLPLWQALWLALALLGSQGLGLLHGLAHGHGLPAAAWVAAAPGHAAAPDGTCAPLAFPDHEAGSATCRLLDQLAPDALVLPALALSQALPSAPTCTPFTAPVRALPAACLPQARAPPSSASA